MMKQREKNRREGEIKLVSMKCHQPRSKKFTLFSKTEIEIAQYSTKASVNKRPFLRSLTDILIINIKHK